MRKSLSALSLLLVSALAFAQTFPVNNLQVNGTSTLSGNISGAGVTNLFAAPPAIGASTPSTGAFTNISASGTSSFGGAMSGAGLTSHDANVNHVQTVANVAALRALSCVSGLLYADQGYYTQGDGANASYVCTSDTTSADNGGSILATANGNRLYINLKGQQVNARLFGAKGDNSANDTTPIQNAINSISTVSAGAGPSNAVYLPAGAYKITSAISLPYGVSIFGAGGNASVLNANGCDGIHLTESVEDGNMQFVQDIGIVGISGVNFTGIVANTGTYPGSQNDGFYIERVNVTNFNVGILLGLAWQSYIEHSIINNTSNAITIGPNATLITISSNQITRGTPPSGSTALNIGIQQTGVNTEADKVINNFIYGFATAITLQQPWQASVFDNTILTANTTGSPQIGIDFSTVIEQLNIYDNIIESTSTTGASVIGVYGRALSSTSGGFTVIQNNRILDDNGLGTGVGVQINSSGNTNQNNVTIQNNSFFGFSANDLILFSPQFATVQNNWFGSTIPANSVSITGTPAPVGPIYIDHNWLHGAMNLPAPYSTNGTIITSNNVVGGTFSPVAPLATWSPADQSGASLSFTQNAQAYYVKNGQSVTAIFDITYPTTASGSTAAISLPFPPISGAGAACSVGFQTFAATFTSATSSGGVASVFFFNTAGTGMTNANLSGKRLNMNCTYISAS